EEMVLSQRRRMREARDKRILGSAVSRYMADHGHELPKHVARLSPSYLTEEPGALWDRYSIEVPDGVPPPPNAVESGGAGAQPQFEFSTKFITASSPAISARHFSSPEYNVVWNQKLI